LVFAGIIWLATRFYIVSEAVTVLVLLAIFFVLVTGVLFAAIFVQECSRWGVRIFKEAKSTTVFALRGPCAVKMPKFVMPGSIGANPEVRLATGAYKAHEEGERVGRGTCHRSSGLLLG
jgi:hypothetical protein